MCGVYQNVQFPVLSPPGREQAWLCSEAIKYCTGPVNVGKQLLDCTGATHCTAHTGWLGAPEAYPGATSSFHPSTVIWTLSEQAGSLGAPFLSQGHKVRMGTHQLAALRTSRALLATGWQDWHTLHSPHNSLSSTFSAAYLWFTADLKPGPKGIKTQEPHQLPLESDGASDICTGDTECLQRACFLSLSSLAKQRGWFMMSIQVTKQQHCGHLCHQLQNNFVCKGAEC